MMSPAASGSLQSTSPSYSPTNTGRSPAYIANVMTPVYQGGVPTSSTPIYNQYGGVTRGVIPGASGGPQVSASYSPTTYSKNELSQSYLYTLLSQTTTKPL